MLDEGADFLEPSDWKPMVRVLATELVLNYLVDYVSTKILYLPASNPLLGCQTRILNARLLPERITITHTKDVVNWQSLLSHRHFPQDTITLEMEL